jgi:hypothetical protein
MATEFQEQVGTYIKKELNEFKVNPYATVYDLSDLSHAHLKANFSFIETSLGHLYLNHYGHLMWDSFYKKRYKEIKQYIESVHDYQYPDTKSANHF